MDLQATLLAERPRLVGLCAYLSGDVGSAEDLAQETLVEAWSHAHELRDPQAAPAWLTGIARNVCLRWARARSRELAHSAPAVSEEDPPDGFDLEVELERGELASLLDRAMALLPPETRALLVEKYVRESPVAGIAEMMGLSEGAVAVRLHRGRLALRRILGIEFRQEAAAYGLVEADDHGWQETRIWCPICGLRRLLARFVPANGEVTFRCPRCLPNYRDESSANIAHVIREGMFDGIKGYKAALNRVMVCGDEYYRQAFAGSDLSCLYCGRPGARLQVGAPQDEARPAILGR
jgi:RNA polymerase sigma factor (sigma-70 family)